MKSPTAPYREPNTAPSLAWSYSVCTQIPIPCGGVPRPREVDEDCIMQEYGGPLHSLLPKRSAARQERDFAGVPRGPCGPLSQNSSSLLDENDSLFTCSAH